LGRREREREGAGEERVRGGGAGVELSGCSTVDKLFTLNHGLYYIKIFKLLVVA